MVQIDHRIAMMGQQPNIVNALAQGTQAAGQVANLRRQAEGQNIFRQHGPGIMAGDPAAMNALAGFDPMAAMGVQSQRQQMTIGEAQLAQIKQSTRLAAEKHAASLGAAEAAMEAQKIANGLNMALPLVIKARETGDVTELNQGLQTLGLPPVRDVNEALVQVAQHEAVFEALERVTAMTAGPDPADEYGRYVQEETAAGRQPLDRISYAQAKKGKGVSMTMPDGTRLEVGGSGQPQDKMDVAGPGAMLDAINGILGDPALENATGMLEWTQAIPGTPMRRFGSRVEQLKGQAFLQAFQMLKGGGQITEIEGKKATDAIGRLDSGQSADDYRNALTELRDVLGRAMQRPRGWIDTSAGKISQMSAAELGALDFHNMTQEEAVAAEARLIELMNQERK